MNFKAYDILSSLVPGFLILLVLLRLADEPFDKDSVVAYTAMAFLLGYMVNTLSSWLEDFYFLTWGGKPSSNLLDGKDIWKVRFYHADEAKALLRADSGKSSAKNDELFSIAMRTANGEKDTRIEDFNALYAFSRALLTAVLFGTVALLIKYHDDWKSYAVLLPALFVVWLRCKQRGYYYSKEILSVYMKKKKQ